MGVTRINILYYPMEICFFIPMTFSDRIGIAEWESATHQHHFGYQVWSSSYHHSNWIGKFAGRCFRWYGSCEVVDTSA